MTDQSPKVITGYHVTGNGVGRVAKSLEVHPIRGMSPRRCGRLGGMCLTMSTLKVWVVDPSGRCVWRGADHDRPGKACVREVRCLMCHGGVQCLAARCVVCRGGCMSRGF